jgi:hypothetical protein
MSKNLIPQIAQMLGVELGEKFKIKGENELMTYSFNSDGLQVTYGDGIEIPYISTNLALVALVNGEEEIIKLSWKPKLNERYWTFMSSLEGGKLYVLNYMWDNSVIDVALHKVGWVFRTCEEAQAALPAVAKELGVEYKL